SGGVETVDVGAAKSLVGSGHLYLDVRTIEEFNKGHPENALNVPYMFFTPQGKPLVPISLDEVWLAL
ncbi:Rhodanese-like domain-containing protein 19, mitochondrial, partial [Ananas comosus]